MAKTLYPLLVGATCTTACGLLGWFLLQVTDADTAALLGALVMPRVIDLGILLVLLQEHGEDYRETRDSIERHGPVVWYMGKIVPGLWIGSVAPAPIWTALLFLAVAELLGYLVRWLYAVLPGRQPDDPQRRATLRGFLIGWPLVLAFTLVAAALRALASL